MTIVHEQMSLLTNSCFAASTTNDADNMNNSSLSVSFAVVLKIKSFLSSAERFRVQVDKEENLI